MKRIMRVGLTAVIAALLIGGTAVVGLAQCPCIVNCPAGDGGITAPPPPGGHKTPDLNGDTIVNIQDLALFAAAYGPAGVYLYCADYNCDGVIDLVDLSIFAAHWLHAGPVPGYNAPGNDHYKLYDTFGPQIPGPFILRDQFWSLTIPDCWLAKLGTPTRKNDEMVCDEFAHQTWYEFPPMPGPMWMIEAEDQFGKHEWMLGDARYLVLPARKNEGVGMPLPELNHYICYDAQGPAVDIPVILVDQFDEVEVFVLHGVYFCNPCEKTTPDGMVYPIIDPWAHMTVYVVDPPMSYGIQALIQDQFVPDWMVVLEHSNLLAVPALKTQVFPAGSSEWHRIKALYE